jgi:hypothetical protein
LQSDDGSPTKRGMKNTHEIWNLKIVWDRSKPDTVSIVQIWEEGLDWLAGTERPESFS